MFRCERLVGWVHRQAEEGPPSESHETSAALRLPSGGAWVVGLARCSGMAAEEHAEQLAGRWRAGQRLAVRATVPGPRPSDDLRRRGRGRAERRGP